MTRPWALWYEPGADMTSFSARWAWLVAALVLAGGFFLLMTPSPAAGEQAASGDRPVQAGYLDAGLEHTCAVLTDHTARCWGVGLAGRLGYGSDADVLSAAAAPPVSVGPGRSVRAISAGYYHTCAILDDATVRCWGFGANGRLGYGGTGNVLSPAGLPPVPLGGPARAITAGASHTCAILGDGTVRCWGNGGSGRLGYGNQASIGDDEAAGAGGPVDLGPGRTARAIAAGDFHTCAILDDGSLRCWGFGASGQLGYGGTGDVGDDERPGQAGPVPIPAGRTARAVAGGTGHTCAILDDGTARCWGLGGNGRLGYGSTGSITSAAAAGPIALGAGRTATAIGAGYAHTCAALDDGAARCWGFGGNGRLGYSSASSIGDNETPATAGPLLLGAAARGLTVGSGAPPPDWPTGEPWLGGAHSCALLVDGTLRCWGVGAGGRLGYGGEGTVGGGGGNPSPAAAGPVPLGPVAGSLGDLSLAMSAGATRLPLGGLVEVTVAVANHGPDPAGAISVSAPAPPGVSWVGATSTQGGFDGVAGRWDLGSLAPGSSAVLRLTARADAAGDHLIASEIARSGTPDPTSIPANGAAEDDRAAVVISVAAPVNQAAATPAAASRLRPRALRMRVTRSPRRGVAKRLTVRGRLVLPRARPPARCRGRVLVRARVGKRVVASRRAVLRARRGVCRYGTVLRPKRTRKASVVRVSARFLGTSELKVRAARTTKVRIRPRR